MVRGPPAGAVSGPPSAGPAAPPDTGRLEVRVERAGGRGTAVTVTVGYPDGTSIPAVAWLFPASIHLEAATTMRQEFGDG